MKKNKLKKLRQNLNKTYTILQTVGLLIAITGVIILTINIATHLTIPYSGSLLFTGAAIWIFAVIVTKLTNPKEKGVKENAE